MRWSPRITRARVDELGRAADESLRHAFATVLDIWNGTDADVRRASDLYSRMTEQVLEAARASLKGTPSDLVAHGRYEIALDASTLEDHGAVLDVYRAELVRELETWRDTMRAHARTQFSLPPTIEFVEDDTLALSEPRVSSSSGGVCLLHRCDAPSEEMTPIATAKALRVRRESGGNAPVEHEFGMRSAPYALGRDQDDARCRISESPRTGREQAVLLGIPEKGEWWLIDGRLDGSPPTNPTRIDGIAMRPQEHRRLMAGMAVEFPGDARWTVLEG